MLVEHLVGNDVDPLYEEIEHLVGFSFIRAYRELHISGALSKK